MNDVATYKKRCRIVRRRVFNMTQCLIFEQSRAVLTSDNLELPQFRSRVATQINRIRSGVFMRVPWSGRTNRRCSFVISKERSNPLYLVWSSQRVNVPFRYNASVSHDLSILGGSREIRDMLILSVSVETNINGICQSSHSLFQSTNFERIISI